MKTNKNNKNTMQTLTYGGILTALVIVLQLLGTFVRFGAFQVSLVLIPIVLGAALCGKYMGAWLGLVFGAVVLLNGDAALFYAFHVPGTIITVLAKGILCGFITGLVYQWIAKKNQTAAIFTAAVVCPVVNTGVFTLGCYTFFINNLPDIAQVIGVGFEGTTAFIFLVLIGVNFLFELGVNVLLSPSVVRLLNVVKKIRGM